MVLQKVIKNHTVVMEEPLKKKQKIEDDDIERELDLFQNHLLNNCLCSLPENVLKKLFWKCQAGNILWSNLTSDWSRDQILTLVTSIQLICEVAMKQNSRGFICSQISNVCNAFSRNSNNLIDYFLELADDSDHYICFATSRTLSSFFLAVKILDQRYLDRVTENLVEFTHPSKLSFSLDVLKRIVEWKDFEEHTLEDTLSENESEKPSRNCQALSILNPERIDLNQIKCLCLNSLEHNWPIIVSRFYDRISISNPSYHNSIITFLNLWEAIISVKANLSVIDTKPFYSNVESYVSLLTQSTPPIIWKHILSLLNEVLCYGSTLALQDLLAEEPCSLAHLIVRNVRNNRDRDRDLLSVVPYREGSGRFGGGTGDGDEVLLKKLILLILKAVAVTVKETRCDSSSDSSLGSEFEDSDADMAVIERSIREVLLQLDRFVKELRPFHPETRLAQWVVQIFTDQDDHLIESMVCCLDVAVGLCYRDNALLDLRHMLNPSITFLQFLHTVSFNVDILLDYLVSNETCFLLYILRYLKYISKNWDEFLYSCGHEIDEVMKVLRRLKSSLERLIAKDMFPYNINPVLKLLKKCENAYDPINRVN